MWRYVMDGLMDKKSPAIWNHGFRNSHPEGPKASGLKENREHIARLEKSGKMKPAGIK